MNEVWQSYMSHYKTGDIAEELAGSLSDSEQARLAGLTQPQRRKQYLLSRAMIRVALSRYYDLPLAHWCLQENPGAAPTLTNPVDMPLYLSLSHSADCIMLAISKRAVGLDVEQMRADRPYPKIAERVFSPTQQATLLSLAGDERMAYFYHLWTSKEALVKLADPAQKISMFTNAPWDTSHYFNGHARFNHYYATLLCVQNIKTFRCYELNSFEQIQKVSLFENNGSIAV